MRTPGLDKFKGADILVLAADNWGGFVYVEKSLLDTPQFIAMLRKHRNDAGKRPFWDKHEALLKAHGYNIEKVAQ